MILADGVALGTDLSQASGLCVYVYFCVYVSALLWKWMWNIFPVEFSSSIE